MNVFSLSAPTQQTTHSRQRYWRLILAFLLLCQSLWITAQPVAAATLQQQEGTLDTPFEIVIGEEATITGENESLIIWFAHVLRDNRCPAGETCAKEGRAEFQFFVSHGDREDNEMFSIDTTEQGRKFQYREYEVELVEVLTPAPKSDENFILLEYRLMLVVRAVEAAPTPEPSTDQADGDAPQMSAEEEFDVALDQSFVLRVGQTAHLSDEDLHITLRSLSEDSGCLDKECSEMAINADLDVKIGDYQEGGSVISTITPEEPYLYEFEGYAILITAVEVLTQGTQAVYRATFYVTTLSEEEPTATGDEQGNPSSQTASGLAPIFVDGCRNFSPFDAAAILQEDVNFYEPVSNLIFGPLLEEGMAEGMKGLCGYSNATITTAERDSNQTHIATQIDYDHVVVADHLTAEILNSATLGVMVTDWFELMALAEVVGASSGVPAGSAYETLYAASNASEYAAVLAVLEDLASQSDSFKVTKVKLNKEDPRDEMLWLWQTLDSGYFSFLISRQGSSFDVVAALLGDHVNEQTVLGYSRVLLEQIAASSDASGCDYLTLDEVEAIVGEPVDAHAVANEQGTGCKYTPVADEVTIDIADFSHYFPYKGLLVGIVPPRAAQHNLTRWLTELSTTGQVRDGEALGTMLAAIDDGELSSALAILGEITWDSPYWQVETLSEVSSDSILIYDIARTDLAPFFVLVNRPDGGLYYLAGVQNQEIDDVRAALVAAVEALAEERVGEQQASDRTTITPIAEEPSSEQSTASTGCSLLTLDEAAAILGEPVQEHTVVGERGDGCKYTPEDEEATVDPDDFSPTFESRGVLAGLMPQEGAAWLLGQFVEEVIAASSDLDEEKVANLTAAIEAGEVKDTLQQLAALAGSAGDWQIEALTEVSDDTVWVHGELPGVVLSFFFRAETEGGMWVIAVQLPEDQEVDAMRDAAVEALLKLPE